MHIFLTIWPKLLQNILICLNRRIVKTTTTLIPSTKYISILGEQVAVFVSDVTAPYIYFDSFL